MPQKQIKHNQIISTRLVFIDKLRHKQYFDNINYSHHWQCQAKSPCLPLFHPLQGNINAETETQTISFADKGGANTTRKDKEKSVIDMERTFFCHEISEG